MKLLKYQWIIVFVVIVIISFFVYKQKKNTAIEDAKAKAKEKAEAKKKEEEKEEALKSDDESNEEGSEEGSYNPNMCLDKCRTFYKRDKSTCHKRFPANSQALKKCLKTSGEKYKSCLDLCQ